MERIGVAPGTEIGGYRVLGPLGQGGMGAVYRAVDGGGTVVALKLLHPHLGADPDARERLRREVAHLQRVRHPGVARVLDAEIDSAEAFIVTELIDGQDLGVRVRTNGPLGAAELADLAEELRAALSEVHAAGVLHRDLTPGNVLVTARGAVLIDFGIAQAAEDARVTSTGMVVGTPGYLSPELLEGGEPTESADWWGWAAVLAFAATGRPPFGTRPVQAVLARVRAGEPDLSGVDRRCAGLLRSALTVDPARRAAPTQVVAELRGLAMAVTDGSGTDDSDGVGADVPATQVLGSGTRVMTWTPTDGGEPTGELAGADGDESADRHEGADEYEDADGYEGADGYDDADGYDEVGEDDAGHEDDDVEPARLDRTAIELLVPRPPRRLGTVLAVGLLLIALGTARPGVALVLAVASAVLVRSIGLAATAVHARRIRRGTARADDVVGGVLLWPWHLVRAVVGVLPSVIVAVSAMVVVGGVAWWLLDTGRFVLAEPGPGQDAGALPGNAPWVVHALLGVAVTVGLVTLWFGPLSRRTRTGARWTLAGVAPGAAGAVTVTVLALAGVVVLLSLVTEGQPVVWWPLPGPPDIG